MYEGLGLVGGAVAIAIMLVVSAKRKKLQPSVDGAAPATEEHSLFAEVAKAADELNVELDKIGLGVLADFVLGIVSRDYLRAAKALRKILGAVRSDDGFVQLFEGVFDRVLQKKLQRADDRQALQRAVTAAKKVE